MCRFSEKRKSKIIELSAKAATEGCDVEGTDYENVAEVVREAFRDMTEGPQFSTLTQVATDLAKHERAKGVSGIKIIGKVAAWLYNAGVNGWCDIKETNGVVLKILKGFLYGLCLIAATIVVVSLGIIAFVVDVIYAILIGVWKVIKMVTGFIWSELKGCYHKLKEILHEIFC